MINLEKLFVRYSVLTLICVSIMILCGIIVIFEIVKQADAIERTQEEVTKLDDLLNGRTAMFKLINDNQIEILKNHKLILQALKNQDKTLKKD